jgi:hypothetical protein
VISSAGVAWSGVVQAAKAPSDGAIRRLVAMKSTNRCIHLCNASPAREVSSSCGAASASCGSRRAPWASKTGARTQRRAHLDWGNLALFLLEHDDEHRENSPIWSTSNPRRTHVGARHRTGRQISHHPQQPHPCGTCARGGAGDMGVRTPTGGQPFEGVPDYSVDWRIRTAFCESENLAR